MNVRQKEQISRMRHEGIGYSKIAQRLGLSENTVKSYCKRNNLGGVGTKFAKLDGAVCKNCMVPIDQLPRQKKRVFCSDTCRVTWWNTHPEMVNRKAVYHLVCARCGTVFESYGNKGRKYCCHSCYIAARFGAKKADAAT